MPTRYQIYGIIDFAERLNPYNAVKQMDYSETVKKLDLLFPWQIAPDTKIMN